MAGYLRLRQICLVAPALRPAEEDIAAVLGVPVCFRDANVAAYGLENALFPLGADILEVVAPTREGTAAGRFLERSGGRGGYMVIVDCDDVARRQAHAGAMGVRTANLIRHDGYLGAQLHPRDCRAAMIEFNHTEGGEDLSGPYHPAGPDWPRLARPGGLPRLVAAELDGPDPAALAAHWGRIMELPVVQEEGVPALRLTEGRILFLRGEAERLSGLRIAVADVAGALSRASQRNLPRAGEASIRLSGVHVTLQAA